MNKLAAALVSIGITTAAALALTQLSTHVLDDYGTGVFILLPVACGSLCSLLYNRRENRGLGPSVGAALLACLVTLSGFVVLGFEGLICLLMAAPLLGPLFVIGGVLGYYLSRLVRRPAARDVLCLLLLALAPIYSGFAPSRRSESPDHSIVSRIVIDGTPEEVWRQVVAFSPMAEPDELFFRLGVAYPKRAHIEGSGPGAVRYCEFSTGPFVEPITDWQPGHRLAFSVVSQPRPMTELGPYGTIHPPHLDWALRSTHGEFLLRPLPGGQVELTGTTWYQLKMAPAAYWTLWSDDMIHTIHLRVLRHIKAEVEKTNAPKFTAETT